MIKISVNKNYKNKDLNELLLLNDVNINECILNYGCLIYNNQKDLILNYSNENFKKEKEILIETIENNKLEYEELKNYLKIDYEKKEKDLKDKYNNEIILLNNNIKNIEDEFFDKENTLKTEFKNKEKELKEIIEINEEEYEQQENNLKIEFKNKEKELKDYHDTKIKKLNIVIENMEDDFKKKENDLIDKYKKREQQFKDDFTKKEDELNKKIEQLKESNTVEINAIINQGYNKAKIDFEKDIKNNEIKYKDKCTDYERLISIKDNEHKEKIDLIQTSLNNEINRCERIINSLNNEKDNLLNKIDDLTNQLHNLNIDFKQQFNIIKDINTPKTLTNTEIGIIGENIVEQYLNDKFSNAQIENTTSSTSMGDLRFKFESINTLIEVKNVKNIKSTEIDKFFKDIDNNVNKINSALFISLNDTYLINNKKFMHFVIHNGIPCLFISNVKNNMILIRFSILFLDFLIKYGITNLNNDQDENDNFNFICYNLKLIYDNFNKQNRLLNEDRKIINKLEQSFNNREKELISIDNIFNIIKNKFNDIFNNNYNIQNLQNNIQYDDNINKLKTFYTNNPNIKINKKNLINNGFSNHFIDKIGGIQAIKKLIKNNFIFI